ncbi:MAG: hypothetical protein MN733_38740, partial [Nitrososphaera sp.]|nr:hypothetical protein [Nitrososphaera sp.]
MAVRRSILLSLIMFILINTTSGIAPAQAQTGGESESQYDLVVRTEKVVANLGSGLSDWCGVTFEFMPDGRIMCGELRGGNIRIIENNTLLPGSLLHLDV